MSSFTGHSDDDDANNNNNGLTPNSNNIINAMMPNTNGQPTFDIEEFCINYNKKFKMANPVAFRDKVIEQTLAVLIAKNKPNACLVGEAGTGKTKIVEDIAQKLANNHPLLPDQLIGYTIYELPLSNIVSGSSFVGQLEQKLKDVLEFISDKKNKAILFIDEIHMLTKDSQTYAKIAQIMKPALARGDIRCIGATTSQEARGLDNDPALNRRFTRLIIDELSKEQTLEILKSMKSSLFMHYRNKIIITDEALEQVVILADQYKTVGSHRPDNAITLLDRTCGSAIIQRKLQEMQAATNQAMLQAIQSINPIPIIPSMVKSVAMKLMTGNNNKPEFDAAILDDQLKRIKGQDDILPEIIKYVKRYNSDIYEKIRPTTMLFAGPSGVGKSEIAKIISNVLTGMPPIVLNMTEYQSAAEINRIIGAPPGYVEADSKTELPFDILSSNPYQVILLDEFEKCHPSVRGLFMSAFETGIVKTNHGTDIDFSKCMIIVTTNASHTGANMNGIGFINNTDTKRTQKQNVKELSKSIKTEILNRFSTRITFNSITKDDYRQIMIETYEINLNRIKREQPYISRKLSDTIPDDELDKMIEDTYIEEFGARPVRETIQNYIEEKIFN